MATCPLAQPLGSLGCGPGSLLQEGSTVPLDLKTKGLCAAVRRETMDDSWEARASSCGPPHRTGALIPISLSSRVGSAWKHEPGEHVYLKKMSKMTSETCLQTCTKWERPFYMFNWRNRKHALCLQISMILTMTFCPIKCVFDLSEDQMCFLSTRWVFCALQRKENVDYLWAHMDLPPRRNSPGRICTFQILEVSMLLSWDESRKPKRLWLVGLSVQLHMRITRGDF